MSCRCAKNTESTATVRTMSRLRLSERNEDKATGLASSPGAGNSFRSSCIQPLSKLPLVYCLSTRLVTPPRRSALALYPYIQLGGNVTASYRNVNNSFQCCMLQSEAMENGTRVGILGCGHWGQNLVRNFHQLGALYAVCDSTEQGRKRSEELAPGVPVHGRF